MSNSTQRNNNSSHNYGLISSSVDWERRGRVEGEKLQLHKNPTLLHIELYTLCAS